jgi:hypothetical protein
MFAKLEPPSNPQLPRQFKGFRGELPIHRKRKSLILTLAHHFPEYGDE